MDKEKLIQRYKTMAVSQLKELAEEYQDMEKEALPLLLDELKSRGEVEYVEQLEQKIEVNPDNRQVPKGFLSTLSEPDSIRIQSKASVEGVLDGSDDLDQLDQSVSTLSEDTEILDDKLSNELFEYDQAEIIRLAIKMILKHKSKITGRIDAEKRITDKWKASEMSILTIFEKLEKKRRNAQTIGGIIAGLFALGILMFLATEGQFGFFPGLIFIILAITNYNTARHLKRIILE